MCRLKPADKDARAKLDECEKAVRRKASGAAPPQAPTPHRSSSSAPPPAQAFEDAIGLEATKPISETIGTEVDAVTVDASYTGPHLPAGEE